MKVLVTGANGYIGRHVIKVLLDRHVEVIACDITTTEVDKRAERMSLNLFDLSVEDVYSFLGTPDVCLHMAWRNGFVHNACLLYTSPSPRDAHESRMPSSA